jgi:hypothetical protein
MHGPKTFASVVWVAGYLTATVLSGCGSGTSAPPLVISVSFVGSSSQTIAQGQSATITASVSNDPAGKGVTWKVTGPGALSKETGTSAEYDAPAGVPSNATAIVTATAVADPTKSAAFTVSFPTPPPLTKLSTDQLTNSNSQHATEVEPDTFASGNTIVSTFHVAHRIGVSSAAIGFATSTDGGVTWTNGLLPGITTFFQGGPFTAASDPSVAYDAAHGQWIIASIGVQDDSSGNPTADQILVSLSPDGLTWGNPIAVNPLVGPKLYDKDWIVCDDTSTSPFYGHCYLQWRDLNLLNVTSTSIDGGLTWQAPLHTTDMVNGVGGQPVVQPNGTVITPLVKLLSTDMQSFVSTDGGASWNSSTEISTITDHTEAGNLRSGPLPSAEIDGAGTVYVVWADCRFRANCSSNDLVLSSSSDGITWTAPARIPIDPVTSTVDHFIPGLAVDRATAGNTAHLTLTYYYFPVSDCGTVCDLYVGFVSSQDGGQTWSASVQIAGPMRTDWLANTPSGFMVGDYISGSYVHGKPFAVFAVAAANSGSVFDEAMYTTTQPMKSAANAARFSSAGEMPVPNAKSDHRPRESPHKSRRLRF